MGSVRTGAGRPARVLHRRRRPRRVPGARHDGSRPPDRGDPRARHRLPAHRGRRARADRLPRQGGGAAVIVLELLAAGLGVAAVVYLLVALVRPERF
ncbi:potassium-transporting ATPase subunit F [Cellulomonas sp. zg-ZUI199]|uniref:Potassium-transporting ATPase subunit F n=1 Tax=Cellulomonas wangleii TaxID=2816956 RepID=A0ABX8D3J2_9CELL|nr:potassium-transporting ATPase subunit F [Cellulomonas sp. zg-ZUI22]MBO0923695.1 potassium-transporting ATPase subunit F [Cellulomonas wangleii]QVI62008.1 potassium-transporting ATPase subunit F [Cellulomonas wangleii]